MTSTRIDPHMAEISRILLDDSAQEQFVRSLRLAPQSSAVRPQRPTSCAGRQPTSEFWGICGQLGFNEALPECTGEVVTAFRKSWKSRRPQFPCNRCRKQLLRQRLQLNGTGALHGIAALRSQVGEPSFFANKDSLGRSNVKMSRAEVLYMTWCMAKYISPASMALAQKGMFKFDLSKQARTEWAKASVKSPPPSSSDGWARRKEVKVDECLLKGK